MKKSIILFLLLTGAFLNNASSLGAIGPYDFFKADRGISKHDEVNSNTTFEIYIAKLFKDCGLDQKQLNYSVFKKAMVGFYNLRSKSLLSDNNIISIIDFTKPSTEERLYIVDVKNRSILFHTLVAHGKNTGANTAINFSNVENSNMSSLGFYVTQNTYIGKHGLSLVIDGVDKNFNTNAKNRSVVIHGAEYVSNDFIKCYGRLGRSLGCPALPMNHHKEIINTIKGRNMLFIFHPNSKYNSEYLNEKLAESQFVKDHLQQS